MRHTTLLFILSFFLNGCFSYTEDIIDHNDGSYSLRKSLTVGESAMLGLSNFEGMFDSVITEIDTQAVKRAFIDTMRTQMTADRDELAIIKGFMSYDVRDTVIDTNYTITTELRTNDIMSLPEFHRITWGIRKQENIPDSKQIELRVRRKGGKTSIAFIPPPEEKKQEKKSKEELEMAKKIAESLKISIRVFSSNLDVPKKGSLITPMEGGQEWRIDIFDLMQNPKKMSKGVEFILNK